MKFSTKEEKLLGYLKKEDLSESHQLDHLKRVATFAVELARIYKGRKEIIVAAALLHDLARSDPKYQGRESALRGAELAKPMLEKAGYSEGEIKIIVRVIAEHDQPGLRSELIESRILKDADFLDGFGARGILRSIMYTTEAGGDIGKALERMRDKGEKRLAGLEFKESKRLGWRLHRLTEVFLDEFSQLNSLDKVDYRGNLVVIEGLSGCGKDTQAELLTQYLKARDKTVRLVNHPTEFLKNLWRQWREEVDDRLSEAFLMMADRARMTRSVILPALKNGEVVVSTRSSISAQVYQYVPDNFTSFYRYCFSFEPTADLIIYLDVDVDTAWERTGKRVGEGKEVDRGFFGKKQQGQKERFKEILKFYPNVKTVDANGEIKAIHKTIIRIVERENIL